MSDGEDDLISALHDDLLGKIISLLPVKEAARTAALASHWRHVWRSTPLFLNDGDLSEPTRAAVSRVLVDHPGPFRSVLLKHCSLPPLSPELAEWPRLLAAKAVKALVFLNLNQPEEAQDQPCVPAEIFHCASLKQLFLGCWTWTLPDQLSRSRIQVVFPHLRRLTLANMAIPDQDLHCLLAACPVLDTLVLACPITEGFNLRNKTIRSVVLFLVMDFAVVEAPLLDRLILLKPSSYDTADPAVRVKVTSTSNLRALGYIDPMIHTLQINGSIIKHDTLASPSTVVPGIEILALKVNFCVLGQVKMVPSLLGRFPNVHTLHIQSVVCDPSDTAHEPYTQFWEEVTLVECLRSHVKKMVFHEFRGHQNEFDFLKFVAKDAKAMQSLLLVPPKGKVLSEDEVDEMIDKLGCPWFGSWTSKVLVLSPEAENDWSLVKASMLTVDDPFR